MGVRVFEGLQSEEGPTNATTFELTLASATGACAEGKIVSVSASVSVHG